MSFILPLRLAPLTVSYVAHELRSCDGGGIPTYHLIQTIVKVFGGKSVRGVIDAPLEGRPKGILVIGKEEDRLDFPCDPADAFTLAMKAGVPIYATREAIQAGGQLFDPHPLQGGLDIEGWIEKLKPEDFSPPQERDGGPKEG